MSDSEDLNHYSPQAEVDMALIAGGNITAVCGEVFEPQLQIGSGGSAADPALEICPACELIISLESELSRFADTKEMSL